MSNATNTSNNRKSKTVYRESAPGIAVHPWVTRADTKFNTDGLFHLGLLLSGAEAEAQKGLIDKAVEEAYNEHLDTLPPPERRKWSKTYPYEEVVDEEGKPNGDWKFTFKQNALIRLKDGTTRNVKPFVADSKGNDIAKPPAIYGGSTLRVMYAMRPIVVAASKQVGIRLDFAGVQIIKLLSSSGRRFSNAGVEDGYTYTGDDADHAAAEGESSGNASKATDGDY